MPLFFHNAVITEHASSIIDYINKNPDSFGGLSSNYWEGRTLQLGQIKDINILNILKKHKDELLSKFYELSKIKETVYIDSLHIVRWPVGYELNPHADGENPDGTKHEFSWRNFGTVTFLNEDFEGGDLYLPNQGLTIKAKTGCSAIFPGTLEYLHGVSKITSGVRYTLASFLTYDKSHEYKI
jgi:hypothetical protein